MSVTKLQYVQAISLYYPDVGFYSYLDYKIHWPVRDKINSLPVNRKFNYERHLPKKLETNPVFLFTYNVDNYYHFVYDTLPYLTFYFKLKKSIKNLKLLISYTGDLHPFVLDFFKALNICEEDLITLNSYTIYSDIYISEKISDREYIYDKITNRSKKIYISRRSYVHKNYDNIGTNYTNKRKLINESELVDFLKTKGYVEVFTELLSTQEKVSLFQNCTHVVGPIGGGLVNTAFCKPGTKLTVIVSPHFLEINDNFCGNFPNMDVKYFDKTEHVEVSDFKKYMRVKIKDSGIVGEIQDMDGDLLLIAYDDSKNIVGWNAQTKYEYLTVSCNEVEKIDQGLNSAWKIDMDYFTNEYFN